MEDASIYADEENEPQVTSPDPNERKLARSLRIQRRWEAIRRQTLVTVEEDFRKEQEAHAINVQLQRSAEVLERFVIEGEEYITNVRIANDAREVDRRENEGINRDKIIQKLEDEIVQAQEMFKNISDKWENIQGYKDPLHIHEDISNQKEKCEELIKQKDAIIAMLQDEIKTAERNFTKDQRKQIEDINTLTQRIEKQISFMRRAYRTELELIENVILTERQAIIEATNRKWDELYKKRETQEGLNSQKKFEQVEEFQGKMEKLRMDFQEKYRETKIKLENDIDELQRELEQIKALAMVNSEKLDYNYQILKKREDENIIIKSQQKRRINKLQDVINDLRKKIDDYETSTANQIRKLEEDIKKLHRSIMEVESKADYFAKVNDEKFHKIWKMNRDQVEEVLKKILDTDKNLYEQQMGIEWVPPTDHVISRKALPSFKSAYALLNLVPSDDTTRSLSLTPVESMPAAAKKESGVHSVTSETSGIFCKEDEKHKVYKRTIKHILTRVSDKSGFLSEKRLGMLLKPYHYDQRDMVRLDNVFEALNIQEQETIDIMVTHFYPYSFCQTCNYPTMLFKVDSMAESKMSIPQSTLSSIYARFGDDQTIVVQELQEVVTAVQIPEEVVEDIVQDLVDFDEFVEQKKSIIQEEERVDSICGGPQQEEDVYYTFTTDRLRDRRSRMSRQSATEAVTSCQRNHPLMISPVYVLTALREFVTTFYVSKEGLPTTGERIQKIRHTVSRNISEGDIVNFWERFKRNFEENRVRVWDALLEGLKRYHEILRDRKIICDEVMNLRKENADLKRLLGNYLEHGEFMIPPCAVQQEENFVKATLPHYTNKK